MSKAIGGSDIAPLLGLSKYKSPYQLWQEKTGKVEKEPLSERQEMGLEMEAVILKMANKKWPEYIFKKSDSTGTFDDNHDYLVCYSDAEALSRDFEGLLDVSHIVSIKNTTRKIGTDDALPEEWVCQLNWELGLWKAERGFVLWLESGAELKIRELVFDADFFEYCRNEAINFWENHVLTDTPPSARTAEDVAEMFPKSQDKAVKADAELYEDWKLLAKKKVEAGLLKDEIEELEGKIKLKLLDCDTLVSEEGKVLVTWKTSKGGVALDTKALMETYPDMANQFMKEKEGVRKFLVKTEKK